MEMTATKAWVAFITAAFGVAALYGVHVTLPDSSVLTAIIGMLIPLVTSGLTYMAPNHPK